MNRMLLKYLFSFTDLNDSCESEIWEIIKEEEDCIYMEWLPVQEYLPQAQPMSFDRPTSTSMDKGFNEKKEN